MLVLSRKVGERIMIGDDVSVQVVRIRDGQVRLAFEAPRHVTILRTELKPHNPPSPEESPDAPPAT